MNQAFNQAHDRPRPLPQPLPTYWWLEKRSYFMFMLREMSCVFVGWFVVFLLMLISAVARGDTGDQGYRAFLNWSARPGIVLLNLVSLGFILLHAITFFNAAPQAVVVRVGETKVAPSVIGGAHYAGLAAVSALVAWILLGA
jgi:fumarate reductase subunit C